MTESVVLAVVGHTNVGKTSLLRTLTRDVAFGEVSPHASTTRHVEGARLLVDGEPVVDLYDTPGLEDAMALLDHLEQLKRPGERPDGPTLLSRFLDGPAARQRFEQEAKVLRQLMASTAGLYVIDAREPVLPKYRDELEVLSMCGKPLLPALNFVARPDNRADDWQQALSRLGLHALLRFDSVAPPLDGEKQLYESLALLTPSARPQLQRLIQDRAAQADARRRRGARLIAELLVDVAAYHILVAPDQTAADAATQTMRERVRQREQACVEALLRLYAFRLKDASAGELPLANGRWEEDPFHPETLKKVGVRLGGGALAGAASGLAIDLMVGGITLGAAAALGALAGSAAEGGRSFGPRVLAKLRGYRELTVDDPILRLLALRQQQLLQALEARGHAALDPVRLDNPAEEVWRSGKLPEPLVKARAYPEWSSLNPQPRLDAAERQAQLSALERIISQPLQSRA
jgi:hypothetical protein